MAWPSAAFLAAALAVASCQTAPPARTTGVDGSWVSADNVYTASLSRGRFEARANDTGGLISQGSYTHAGGKVTINWFGIVSGKDNSAQCDLVGNGLLQCTDQLGNEFALRRL